MNPKVRALVKKRNGLRKQVGTRREEWLAARQEVREERDKPRSRLGQNLSRTWRSATM
jgi:hypothetical protein